MMLISFQTLLKVRVYRCVVCIHNQDIGGKTTVLSDEIPRARNSTHAIWYSQPWMTMKICRLVLLAWLLSSSMNFVKGRLLQLMLLFMLLPHMSIIYRSGWTFSFRSGPSLPGWRSTGAYVLFFIRDRAQMGVHCFPWEYHLHSKVHHITWCQWYTVLTTDSQHLLDHFLKALWSRQLTIGIQDSSLSCKQRSEWNCGELFWRLNINWISSNNHNLHHRRWI